MEKKYIWQFLEQRPYYTGAWDTALVEGERRVVFLLRVPREEAAPLPEKIPVYWKAGILTHKKVYIFLVMANVIPLWLIAEFWFNYIHPNVKEAVSLLATQPHLYLFFHDVGPTPVRRFAFPNGMKFDIVIMDKMLKEAKPWTDAEFDEAKAAIQATYGIEQLWERM